MNVVRALQRTPHRNAFLCVKLGDHSVIFYIELFLRARCVFALDDEVGTLPHGINSALFD